MDLDLVEAEQLTVLDLALLTGTIMVNFPLISQRHCININK
jgi:hypothetical protein